MYKWIAAVLAVVVVFALLGVAKADHSSQKQQGKTSVTYERDSLMRVRRVTIHRADGSTEFIVPATQHGITFLVPTTQSDS